MPTFNFLLYVFSFIQDFLFSNLQLNNINYSNASFKKSVKKKENIENAYG